MATETVLAIVFLFTQTGLMIGLVFGFFWMRNRERDTRLPSEEGLTPRIEVLGSGKIDQRQWTRVKGCRISVYDDFLVVSANSQRLRIPLRLIESVRDSGDELQIEGLTDKEASTHVSFRSPETAALATCLASSRDTSIPENTP